MRPTEIPSQALGNLQTSQAQHTPLNPAGGPPPCLQTASVKPLQLGFPTLFSIWHAVYPCQSRTSPTSPGIPPSQAELHLTRSTVPHSHVSQAPAGMALPCAAVQGLMDWLLCCPWSSNPSSPSHPDNSQLWHTRDHSWRTGLCSALC